jgi:hypothetical protein
MAGVRLDWLPEDIWLISMGISSRSTVVKGISIRLLVDLIAHWDNLPILAVW